MSSQAFEVNFDGLVGITHCYGGLSPGNLPSEQHQGQVSNPRQAALQGLEKMKLLHDLGVKQGVLPPQERPHLPTLRALGFQGTLENMLKTATAAAPWLIPPLSSSSSMWTANAATINPSADASDRHVHFTPANMPTYLHRSIEAETTGKILKAIFKNPVFFTHHDSLPFGGIFYDEGSANQLRFCNNYGSPGVQLFVFGKSFAPLEIPLPEPAQYPARQSKEGSEAIIRLHKIFRDRSVLAQQHPDAIDAGVFHNDLAGFGNQRVFILHEKAFWKQNLVLEELKRKVETITEASLQVFEVKEEEIPLAKAVSTYFFNSQLVTLPDQSMALIAPIECQRDEGVQNYLRRLIESRDNPILSTRYVDLSQSLQNGGGPACLRLRVVLNNIELNEMNQSVLFSETLYQQLKNYIIRYYPTRLTLQDLNDPALYQLNQEALNELSKILNLPLIYHFQTL